MADQLTLHLHLPKGVPVSEWDEQFLQGMINRMAISFFKYGLVAVAYPAKVNALESLQQRLAKYQETGNTEYLIDAANFAMIEFMCPAHPSAHFEPTDADGSPGRTWQHGMVSDKPNVEKFTYKREGD